MKRARTETARLKLKLESLRALTLSTGDLVRAAGGVINHDLDTGSRPVSRSGNQ